MNKTFLSKHIKLNEISKRTMINSSNPKIPSSKPKSLIKSNNNSTEIEKKTTETDTPVSVVNITQRDTTDMPNYNPPLQKLPHNPPLQDLPKIYTPKNSVAESVENKPSGYYGLFNKAVQPKENNQNVDEKKAIIEEKTVIEEAVSKKLLKYTHSGQYGNNGRLALTSKSYEYARESQPKITFKNQSNDNDNDTEILQESIPTQNNNVVLTLNVSEDTAVLTTEQSHSVIAEINNDTNTYEAYALLTSKAQISDNTETFKSPDNIKISDTQFFSGKQQPQYGIPLIPRLIVKYQDACEVENVNEFLTDPNVEATLDSIKNQTQKYVPIDYNPRGITIENIKELIEKNNVEIKNTEIGVDENISSETLNNNQNDAHEHEHDI